MRILLVALLGLGTGVSQGAVRSADEILSSSGRVDGLCVLVNVSDPALAVALAEKSRFVIHVAHDDANEVATMRKVVDRHGLYGRVSVCESSFPNNSLPYAENLVNLLVAESDVAKAEVTRVLAPYGVAFVDGQRIEKPYPKEMDEWTHFRHDATGNMVADDTLVGPPRHVSWVAGPMWQRHHALTPGTTVMVGANGRIFYIQDESPISFGGLPDQWRLIARDAFNGKRLWSREMGPWGDSVWSWWSGGHGARHNHPGHVNKRLVAGADRIFVTLGFNKPISALDPATGDTLMEYQGTAFADEMVFRDGVLYVSVNDRPQKPLPGVGFSVRATAENSSKKTIVAIKPETGKVLWKAGHYAGVSEHSDRLRSMRQAFLVASEKGVFLIGNNNTVVGLDLENGRERFQTSVKVSGKTSFAYHRGMLLIADKSALIVVDAETGDIQWNTKIGSIAKINVPDVYGIGDLVWVGDSKRMTIQAFDLATGEEWRKLSIEKALANAAHHHRCYPNKSTVNFMITGRRGAEFTNYETGEVTLNHWARGQCHYGLMPANGLLYKLPDPCTCHQAAKLLGFYALASESTTEEFFQGDKPEVPRLRKGPAYDRIEASSPQTIEPTTEWPQFRHDVQRSSSVMTDVPDDAELLWKVDLKGRLTPPVIAGGQVYISAIDEHKVYALDAEHGGRLWTFIAGGRVDSPPSIWRGRVLFGSADGCVHCLRATDGELVWRFRAAPFERNIMANDRVESAWPVHGSVTLGNGVVYCTAGRSSFVDGGIYLYALDAVTGGVLSENVIHEVQTTDRQSAKVMPTESPGAAANILTVHASQLFSRGRALDFGTPFQAGDNDFIFPADSYLDVGSAFSDQHWFHRLSWTYGQATGHLIAFDEDSSYAVYPFKKPGNTNRKLYVPVGGDVSMIPDLNKVTEEETGLHYLADVETGGFLLKKQDNSGETVWQLPSFQIGPVAMVTTKNKVLVAGFVDKIDPSDPWARIAGRRGGVLRVLRKDTGSTSREYKLDGLPVWNGMAVASHKVVLALKNGQLICLGQSSR